MNIFGGKEDQEVKLESSTYGTEYFCLMDLDELEEDERGKTKFIRNAPKGTNILHELINRHEIWLQNHPDDEDTTTDYSYT